MTSISVVQPAALLILQQTNAQPAQNSEDKDNKADLVQVANGITGEPAEETLKATFAVSVAFMELDAKGELAAEAMEFIDSDQFKDHRSHRQADVEAGDLREGMGIYAAGEAAAGGP